MAQGVGLEFRLLGPFEVLSGGRALDVGGRQLRGVLARLVVDAGRTVSLAALVDELWAQHAPEDASRTMRTYVSRLRGVLRREVGDGAVEELLITRPPGYQLAVAPEAIDATRFERLAAAGRRELADGRPEPAYATLGAALDLWRGDALAEFDELPTLAGEAVRLDRMRLTVVEDRVEAALAAGTERRIVDELEGLVRANPLRERLWGQLMTALYRSGRQADALAAFRDARKVLVDALGVEPSPDLAELRLRILRHDASLLGAAGVNRGAAHRAAAPERPGSQVAPVPAQLPLARAGFTGRDGELARLDALLATARQGAGSSRRPGSVAVPIAVLSGTAGVGKTALAVQWAHRVAGDFPDGQLYVDLRGFDAGAAAADPADAVRGFIDAFGVPVPRIPAGLPAQSGLYRSLVAGKRVLVLLDNARDAAQVRPLLPGWAGCFVVVTSRDRLTPLVAVEGAHPLTLELLTAAEARELLVRRLGSKRVAGEPKAVEQIIARCAGLPLALAIVAARVAGRPEFPLSGFAAELDDATARLDALRGGDPGTDVRAVFSWSYRTLSPGAARLFRLLGLHPGPAVSVAAVASLCGVPVPEVRPSLAELGAANLLTEHAPGRYTLHDLLRTYAIEQSHGEESDAARREAMRRMFDHYLHSAHEAARLGPQMRHSTPTELGPGVTLDVAVDRRAALAWFGTEHSVLIRIVEHARTAGFDAHCWQLARAYTGYLRYTSRWRELSAIQHSALDAARRLADPAGQAYALRGLGLADQGTGRLDSARTRLLSALDLFDEAGDVLGKARAQESLARAASAAGRLGEALDHMARALDLCCVVGDTAGQASALNDLSWYQAKRGEYQEALRNCLQAVELQQKIGDRYALAYSWDTLGYIHRHLHDHERAISCYQQSLELFLEYGEVYSEAITLAYLGDAHRDAGDLDAARRAWLLALRIFDRLEHPDAAQVRGKLRALHTL